MGKLLRAMKAEQRKLWSKGSLLGCFVLVFVLSFALSFMCSVVKESGADADGLFSNVHAAAAFSEPDNEGWREKTKAKLEGYEKEIEAIALEIPETSGTQKAVLEHRITQLSRDQAVAQYRLDNNLVIWDWSSSYSLILCLWLMIPVVAVITIIYASDIFAGEFVRGTVRVIISRPATRIKLYAAKLLTALLLGVLFMGVAYAAAGIGCGVLMEPSGGEYVGYINGRIYTSDWGMHVFTVFLCCCGMVAVCVALCAAVGNMTRSRGISGICSAVLAVGGMSVGPLAGLVDSGVLGVALPFCFDLTVPLCASPYGNGCSFISCVISVAVHFLVFSYLGYSSFRRDI
ncbi:MAG: hypothetical protein E7554_08470 [Ruminococcaceae bacterium]|nr:hypothetical protein [Oscillospiraceae bacterium]